MIELEMWQLAQKQGLPLGVKVLMTKLRIRQWYEEHEGNVYIAFSGGKDSTVLLHLAREEYPDIPGVFCDTGLEYPEIRNFVKTIPNVEWLKPKMRFKEVLEKYGYPLISKEQSQYIYQYRTHKSEKTKETRWNGNKYGRGKISEKWKFLVHAPFKISDMCCDIMKHGPSIKYEKETGRKPIVGVMASESSGRQTNYLRYGCNAFETARPISKPLSFWNDNDIWEYIRKNNIPYSPIYDMGYERTGCSYCMYGVHLDKGENKFQLMKKTHPRLWEYCMYDLGLSYILNYINVDYGGQMDLVEYIEIIKKESPCKG